LLDPIIGRHDEVAAPLNAELSDNSDVRPAQDTDNFALCPTLARNSPDMDQRTVAMHGFGSFIGREKDISPDVFVHLIGNQKPKAIAMYGDAACRILRVTADANIVPGAQFYNQALVCQAVERVFERITVFALQPQFANKLLVCRPRMRQVADMLQQARIAKGLLHNRIIGTGRSDPDIVACMELKAVSLTIPESGNIIVGQSHFIKTVEDIYEAIVNTSPHLQFGVAFNEASGECLIRFDGNDESLKQNAIQNATTIAAGHVFVIALRNGFPINILDRIKAVPEVVNIYCASANPVEVIVAETDQGRGILGVIDGSRPKGVETESHARARVELLQKFGYKR